MSKKKNKNRIIVNQREIDLLNKYYEIDNENRIVTMPLHYDKASDLINGKIVSKDNYLFDYDELSSINDMIKRVPFMYKININIQIDDYEDYDPDKLLSGFNDAMELNQYNYQRERKNNFLKAGLLLVVGISILFAIAYAKLNGWFGESKAAEVYSEIFDIFGWVFIWECVTVAFLTPSELGVNGNMFKLRVMNVSFYDIENKLLCSEHLGDQAKKWETEKRVEFVSKWSLLISGIGFLAMGVMGAISTVTSISDLVAIYNEIETASDVVALVLVVFLEVLIAVIEILGGVSALARYNGRVILRKFSYIFVGLLIIMAIIIAIVNFGTAQYMVSTIATILISILYIFGLISNRIVNSTKVENKE